MRRRRARPAVPGPDRLVGARGVLEHTLWALRLAWTTAPRLTGGLAATVLVRAVVPVGLALVLRGLVDALAPRHATVAAPVVWFWIGLAAVLAFVQIAGRSATSTSVGGCTTS